ncbi:MAG: SIMPL domain-containing protein [Patescibacteria group bacterium]
MNETQSNTFIAWVQATPLRKGILSTIFIFIALALVATTVLLFKQASRVGVSENYPQTLNVTGKAEEYVKPDTLQFNISINEEGKDVGEATKKAGDKVAQAITILKANGVEEKNIKTSNYSVQDKYDSVSEPCAYSSSAVSSDMRVMAVAPCTNTTSKIVGSTVYQSLEVKIQDIEKNATAEQRSKIVGELAAANIKTDGFTFTVFDLDAVKARVREEAIKEARADAKVLARNLGVKLRGLSSFSEGGDYMPYAYGSARAEMMSAKDVAAPMVPTVQLPTGEQKVTSTVTLTYLIK